MHRSALSYADALAQAKDIISARRTRHGNARMEGPSDPPAPGAAPETDAGPQSDKDTRTADQKLSDLEAKFETLQANSRKWEDRAKDNKKDADAWRAAQAANATPDQKLAAETKRADDAERELARYKVAAEVGVPAELLAGDDEEGIRAHATRIKAYAGDKGKTTPKPDPSQGGSGGAPKPSAADDGRAEAARRGYGKTN